MTTKAVHAAQELVKLRIRQCGGKLSDYSTTAITGAAEMWLQVQAEKALAKEQAKAERKAKRRAKS